MEDLNLENTLPEVNTDINDVNTSPEATTTETIPQPTIKVKFNHEEKEISLDEAREYAQKGMNYDKVTEKLQQLQNDPRITLIDRLANQAGVSTEDYLQAVEEQTRQSQIEELAEQNGIPDHLAEQLLELTNFKKSVEAERTQKQKDAHLQNEINQFVNMHPDVKADQIPAEVWQEVNSGKSLLDAYAKHENNILKQQISEYEKKLNISNSNARNAAASTGSVTGQGVVHGSVLTEEMIADMHPSELAKRWNEVKKVLNMK